MSEADHDGLTDALASGGDWEGALKKVKHVLQTRSPLSPFPPSSSRKPSLAIILDTHYLSVAAKAFSMPPEQMY